MDLNCILALSKKLACLADAYQHFCYCANVRKTGTLQRMNSKSFNNKKSLSQQDGCDDHTRREKPARAYNSNTMPQALPAGATSSSAYINTSDLKG